jgi:monofunctional chorismate mutase
MLQLFEQRMELSAQIADIKKNQGLAVFDAAREQQILDDIGAKLPEPLQEYGKRLFRELMDLSKDYQKQRMEEDETC